MAMKRTAKKAAKAKRPAKTAAKRNVRRSARASQLAGYGPPQWSPRQEALHMALQSHAGQHVELIIDAAQRYEGYLSGAAKKSAKVAKGRGR